ncbi:MAG: hypothetical protein E4H01_16115, partial [Lysobacterales bacterium]
LAFSNNSRMLVGISDSCLVAWKLAGPLQTAGAVAQNGKSDFCVPAPHSLASVGVDSGGVYAAAGGKDGTVWVWRLSGRPEVKRPFKAHNGQVNDISFRPGNDSAILTSGDDGTVRLWSIDGRALARFTGHQGRVLDVDFSTNGFTAASAGKDDTVRVWAAHWKQWLTLGCRRLANHERFRRPELGVDEQSRTRAEDARRVCQRLEIKKG